MTHTPTADPPWPWAPVTSLRHDVEPGDRELVRPERHLLVQLVEPLPEVHLAVHRRRSSARRLGSLRHGDASQTITAGSRQYQARAGRAAASLAVAGQGSRLGGLPP